MLTNDTEGQRGSPPTALQKGNAALRSSPTTFCSRASTTDASIQASGKLQVVVTCWSLSENPAE